MELKIENRSIKTKPVIHKGKSKKTFMCCSCGVPFEIQPGQRFKEVNQTDQENKNLIGQKVCFECLAHRAWSLLLSIIDPEKGEREDKRKKLRVL